MIRVHEAAVGVLNDRAANARRKIERHHRPPLAELIEDESPPGSKRPFVALSDEELAIRTRSQQAHVR
jgi:hypothetical protein